MNTRTYYYETLIPNYLKMLDDLDNGVVGANLLKNDTTTICANLNTILDYIVNEYPDYIKTEWDSNNVKQFRDKVCSPDHIVGRYKLDDFYSYVRDIAECNRHKKLNSERAKIESSADIIESVASIRYSDEQGYYYSQKNIVVFSGKEGGISPCEIYIYFAFVFITEILISAGVIHSYPNIPILQRDFYISRSDAEAQAPSKMQGIAGERFDMKLESYIYEINGPLQIRVLKEGDEFNCLIPTTFEVVKNKYV